MANTGTYLNFRRGTEEAFAFYRSVFGGDFVGGIMRHGDVTPDDMPAPEGAPRLSEEDKQVVARARRIERFLSQPFFVAEAFTGKSGEFTKLEDTIRSFEELCDGKYDHLPEGAFMYVGPIDQAVEAAKKMMGK